MKYEILKESRKYDGTVLHRIKALKNFADVKKGDLGGWIESEANLSQEDDCWIYDNSIVKDNARVVGNSKIMNQSVILHTTTIIKNSTIKKASRIGNRAVILHSGVKCTDLIIGNIYIDNSILCNTIIMDNITIINSELHNIECSGSTVINDSIVETCCIYTEIGSNNNIKNATISGDRFAILDRQIKNRHIIANINVKEYINE